MIYQVAVCDDNLDDAQYIVSLVQQWAGQCHRQVRIRTFSSAEAFLFEYSGDQGFDLLLLDIEMGAMDGVALAKRLRQDNDTLQIIFITGYPDYISEGYDVAALHYLMKPVRKDKLWEVLDRAAKLSQIKRPSLLVSTGRETVRILFDDIYYAESQGHYMLVRTAGEEYRLRMTVSEMLERLGEGFYRCSRSFVVSLRHVSRVTKSGVLLENQVTLPLGRGQYDEMNKRLISYLRLL